jgi:hypothetical protein
MAKPTSQPKYENVKNVPIPLGRIRSCVLTDMELYDIGSDLIDRQADSAFIVP